MVSIVNNMTQSSGRWIWVPDQGALVPPSSGMSSTHSRARQLWQPCTWSYHDTSFCLNDSKCQQFLWMRTHKSRAGWKLVLDNSSGLIQRECWRGGGGAAEDRQLLKPAANLLQPRTCTQSPAFVQPDWKLPGIQELTYKKRHLYKHLPEVSFSKWKLVVPRMAEGISSCFYMTASASLPQNSPINTPARSFETAWPRIYLRTLSPFPTELWATGSVVKPSFIPSNF